MHVSSKNFRPLSRLRTGRRNFFVYHFSLLTPLVGAKNHVNHMFLLQLLIVWSCSSEIASITENEPNLKLQEQILARKKKVFINIITFFEQFKGWNFILIRSSLKTVNGHTMLKIPVLVRSPKSSNIGRGQYLGGWPPGNTACRWHSFLAHMVLSWFS